MSSIFPFQAGELYQWLTNKDDIVLLDVRNSKDFSRFPVEGPYPFAMQNISYFDFMEIEEESVAQLDKSKPVRVVCAKEGSAKFVAEILENNGFSDIGFLAGGIKAWGNLLVPVLLNPNEEYELYQFIRPGKASCSYGLAANGELMLFDPSRAIDVYQQFAQEKGLKLVRSCETHLQADYIAGSRMLAAATGLEVGANESDFAGARFPYTPLKDGQSFGLSKNGPDVKVMYTPGHTPGSTSFIIDDRFMLTGDAVFLQSVGRPDLGGKVDEWSDILFATLQKVQQLDQDLIVLPGHYISWSEANSDLAFAAPLKDAIAHNKDIYAIDNERDFLAFIKDNMREQPKEYATIRKINANLEEVDDDKAEELDLGKNECAASKHKAQQNSA